MSMRFACRRRTAAEWTSLNEVLLLGEWGVETDLLPDGVKAKIGDGVTAYNDLAYALDSTTGVTTIADLAALIGTSPATIRAALGLGTAALAATGDFDAAGAAAAAQAAAIAASDPVGAAAAAQAYAIQRAHHTGGQDANTITSGTIDIARLPAGALERLVPVANQAARYALTTASVQLGDTVKENDTGLLWYVVDEANLGNAAGYVEYTAGAAAAVPWSGVSSKPQTITDLAAITGNDDDIVQKIGGSWVSRTMAQLKTKLALVAADISNFAATVVSTIQGGVANPLFTGALRRESEVPTYTMSAGATLPYPAAETEVWCQYVQTAAAGWTKIFEGTIVYTTDANRVFVRGEVNFGGSQYGTDGGPPFGFVVALRVNAGGTLSVAGYTHVSGQNPGTTIFVRCYYRLNGSGQYVLSIYVYDSGATARRIDAKLIITSGHATDVLNVWQAGEYTAVDPAGANTEITRLGLSLISLASSAATSYTITEADHMRKISFTAATQIDVTFTGTAMFQGFYCELVQTGAGQIVVTGGGSVVMRTSGTAKSRAVGAYLFIRGVSTVLADVMGDVSAS